VRARVRRQDDPILEQDADTVRHVLTFSAWRNSPSITRMAHLSSR
jgi:hypothetical protein